MPNASQQYTRVPSSTNYFLSRKGYHKHGQIHSDLQGDRWMTTKRNQGHISILLAKPPTYSEE